VKKNDQDNLFISRASSNNASEINRIKTTNINILLNRVKLDKKKTLKKKIIFVITLFVGISLLAAYFVS
tara:strand:+ start:534 stop:740 length:207 start_codon:yes stop_codon:yes gene_type:complete